MIFLTILLEIGLKRRQHIQNVVDNGTFYSFFLSIVFRYFLEIGLREAAHSERSGE